MDIEWLISNIYYKYIKIIDLKKMNEKFYIIPKVIYIYI